MRNSYNGVSLRYVELGDATFEPMILLHGYTDSSRSWQQSAEWLRLYYHLIIPDQRGHGDSEKPDCCYAIQDFTNDVVTLMNDLEIDSTIIVGHSMGSFIGQQLAIEYPDRVKHLVLIGSAAKVANNSMLFNVWKVAQTLTYPIPSAFLEEWTANPTPVNEMFLSHIKTETTELPIATWQKAALGLLTYDASQLLSTVKVHTLIIWGDKDPLFTVNDQDALREAMPLAKFQTYEGVGHNVQWEQGERVAEDIVEFTQP